MSSMDFDTRLAIFEMDQSSTSHVRAKKAFPARKLRRTSAGSTISALLAFAVTLISL